MANQGSKLTNHKRGEPSSALNAICPYYTMFPLSFPLSVLRRFGNAKLRILDPFCGRGTTIFAARILGHKAYGIDRSPIAIAIARAKLAIVTEADVIALAERILRERIGVWVPKGEFWQWAYAPATLRDICILRKGLRGLRCGAADILRAICLGALHGPLSKSPNERSYFSNQMPRTFASKPDYSVRFWQERKQRADEVDILKVIKRRLKRLELDTLPKPVGASRVSAADARHARGYASIPSKVDVVITSPPYYGMRTYVADQWLRNWFLGGPSKVPYGEESFLSHQSPEAFAKSLAQVWNQVGEKIARGGRMFVRFGAIPSRKRNPKEILLGSLKHSEFDWQVRCVRRAETADSGKRQACHMGSRIRSSAIEEHDYEISMA
jgi:DNA modification methylase